MKFKINDRIKYTSGHWGDEGINPLWDGRLGRIVGTIIGMSSALNYVVRWDNNRTNDYYENDLELVDTEIDIIMFEEIIDNL